MPSWVTASSSAGSSPAGPADRAPPISDYFRDSRSDPTTSQGVGRRARPKNSVDAARGVEVGLACPSAMPGGTRHLRPGAAGVLPPTRLPEWNRGRPDGHAHGVAVLRAAGVAGGAGGPGRADTAR